MGPLRPSGMERMFLSAAPHLHAAVESVIVGQGDSHPFAQQLTDAGYRVEPTAPLKSVGGAKAWVELLRREQPDVVHIHTEGAFAPAVLATKYALPKTPIVRTIHNVFHPTGKARLSRKAQGLAADRFVSQFIAVSPDVQVNEHDYGRNARLILNWVDDRFYAARARRDETAPPAAVIVGNPSPIKNHLLALRAVEATGMDLYYHGDEKGANAEELNALNRMDQGGRLRHRGLGDPLESLKAGSVFLMPSRHEGMPIALSEALVAGLPAILNDAPGMQWARGFPNVIMINDDQKVWNQALTNVEASGIYNYEHPDELPLDLTAKRGAAEYVEVYATLN